MNIFFDIDTSGLELQDRICAMGIYAQEIALYELVDPEKKISPHASAHHHITNEMVQQSPFFPNTQGYSFLMQHNTQSNTLIVTQSTFVNSMLLKEKFLFQGEMIALLRVVKHLIPECEAFTLQYLRYELQLYKEETGAVPLNALGDCYVLELLYRYLLTMVSHEEMIRLSKECVLLQKFSFGKYKDRYIEEIASLDQGYLRWMLTLDDLDEDLSYSVQYYLKG